MRISFPHMGNLSIALETVFRELGAQVVVPPPVSEATVKTGTGYAPVDCCLPFKIVLGTIAQALDSGADTFIMLGGNGPCRFGYFGHLAAAILRDRGYVFSTVILEGENISREVSILRREFGASRRSALRALWLGWLKLKALDEIERILHQVRPVKGMPGIASAVYRQGVQKIKAARAPEEIRRVTDAVGHCFLNCKPVTGDGIRIGLVGDIYMLLEPYVNYGLEECLESMGITTHRSIYISDWVAQHLWPHKNRRYLNNMLALARPYLSSVVGGHGLDTVANTIHYAQTGYDGVIHILPLTCMPEIVAQSILPKVTTDYDIPVLSLVLDEHSSHTGVLSRLEAFVDILHSRRRLINCQRRGKAKKRSFC
ncbi:CoA protein activase [bacterium]|nr:MAG: CoA protein activase [bacterium]